jgi:hypothetical protein
MPLLRGKNWPYRNYRTGFELPWNLEGWRGNLSIAVRRHWGGIPDLLAFMRRMHGEFDKNNTNLVVVTESARESARYSQLRQCPSHCCSDLSRNGPRHSWNTTLTVDGWISPARGVGGACAPESTSVIWTRGSRLLGGGRSWS